MSDDPISDACFEVALGICVETVPTDSLAVRAYAARLTAIAKELVSADLGRDPALVSRAVRYIDQVHAIPPMKNDTAWFWNMLSAVVEVARPNTGSVEGEALSFLDDIQQGITILKQG
jgi:hypothetical protein